ncbi:MAG: phosphoribosyltransferase [Acidimicrobiales bacterium]|nr:phosphoribosyltransferase [Acidimicrobiales bacterium]MCB9392153.1 phosphoribosyltransferase [Acidimicrobiaceae bacterium]
MYASRRRVTLPDPRSRPPFVVDLTPHLDACWVLDRTSDPEQGTTLVGDLIADVRVRPMQRVTAALAARMADTVELIGGVDDLVVVPVPSANPAAEVLARAVACSLELPFERLVRSRWATRFAPPEEHFTVRARQVPTSVLLVDDLVRTGGSMRGCAARLRRRGVVDVWGIAAAADLDASSPDTASLALRELELDAS